MHSFGRVWGSELSRLRRPGLRGLSMFEFCKYVNTQLLTVG